MLSDGFREFPMCGCRSCLGCEEFWQADKIVAGHRQGELEAELLDAPKPGAPRPIVLPATPFPPCFADFQSWTRDEGLCAEAAGPSRIVAPSLARFRQKEKDFEPPPHSARWAGVATT